jgi:hypothetical protein
MGEIMVSANNSEHSACTHSTTFLSQEGDQSMVDCMSGKLSFLSGFLVSMPENIFLIFVAAVVSLIFLNNSLSVLKNTFSIMYSRWRVLYLDYFAVAIFLLRKSLIGWLIRVEHPVLVA